MAPYSQNVSRGDTTTDSSPSNPMTPVDIAGVALAAAVLLALCLWLGIRAYRRRRHDPTTQAMSGEKVTPRPRTTAKGVIGQPIYFSRDQITRSIVLPQQGNVGPAQPPETKEEILQRHLAGGTMTRPFAVASGTLPPSSPSNAAPRPVSTVSFLGAASRTPSPRRTSFFAFGQRERPSSVASSVLTTVSTLVGVEGRKVRQLFSPVLPDELVLSLGERVTVLKTFDDGWCVVGRDSLLKPGDIEMGAVPAWCFVKPVKGLKASRPMRTTSLGVTVEIESGPGFSSREEVISWSNF